jgi:hypothetical protein
MWCKIIENILDILDMADIRVRDIPDMSGIVSGVFLAFYMIMSGMSRIFAIIIIIKFTQLRGT